MLSADEISADLCSSVPKPCKVCQTLPPEVLDGIKKAWSTGKVPMAMINRWLREHDYEFGDTTVRRHFWHLK